MKSTAAFQCTVLIFPLLDISSGHRTYTSINDFKVTENWPIYNSFGQISGVGIDNSNNVYIFHRGHREWSYNTFSNSNIFLDIDKGPINTETIVVLNPNTGSLLTKTGKSLFYLPHGLTVDHENNIWVTDVAMHQVFKFSALNITTNNHTSLGNPILSLGKPFTPGSDDLHFCKPTDVAIDIKTNDIFVSDGYCNSRIMKFDQYGKKLLNFGRSSVGNPTNNLYMLQVPHALALAANNDLLFVADRENFRVVSFDGRTGKSSQQVFAEELKSRVFSVAYLSLNNSISKSEHLFILTNSSNFSKSVAVYNIKTRKHLLDLLPTNSFNNPHDIAVSKDGQYCYVVELSPYKVWQFKLYFSREISDVRKSEGNEKPYSGLNNNSYMTAELNNPDNIITGNATIAIALVISVVILTFIFFLFHYQRRKDYRRYESRRLILDNNEDDEADDGVGGIRLT